MAPPPVARRKIEQLGIDAVLEQLGNGIGQRQIAASIGVDVMSLNRYLHDNPLHSARVRESMRLGAEYYEERAASILEEAREEIRGDPQLSGSIVALARERAQACWRRATVRDPDRYSDKRTATLDVTVTHTAQLSTADLERIASQALTLLPDGTVEGGTSDIGEAGE